MNATTLVDVRWLPAFRPVVVEQTQLDQALNGSYRLRIELAVVEDTREEESRVDDIRDMASSTPTISLVNKLLTTAIEEGASDLHFEPKRDRLLIRMRVDGVMRDVADVPKHMQPAVTSRLKVMGSLDIAERRLPQDGRVSVHFGGEPLDLRIAVMPLRHGEQVVLRILSRRGQRPRLERPRPRRPIALALRRGARAPVRRDRRLRPDGQRQDDDALRRARPHRRVGSRGHDRR